LLKSFAILFYYRHQKTITKAHYIINSKPVSVRELIPGKSCYPDWRRNRCGSWTQALCRHFARYYTYIHTLWMRWSKYQ